ncbi:hypothetical protein F511_33205 [Dorcoceras hygrometricum]|uniref:Uncharacterized protein n=1 Tax=Dorcoceras hygrometricum TaxID=472368 RepID=A0A2Z7AUJ7_9LAMI|nr:hypothetical protein F511_33205 [Dorcoceras hygrometricum]
MGATHSSQHTAPDATHGSTCCCPTHEVWELPTPPIVANRSQQGDEVRQLPAQPQQCSVQQRNIYIRKAYTTASIITHAKSKAVKQAQIRASSLLCYNYYNGVPSNTDLTPAKPNTDTNSGTVTQKPRIGSYKLNPSLSYPSNTTEGSKQSISFKQACKNSIKRSSQQEESSATTLTSIEAVYRRQSEKIRHGLLPKQIRTNSNNVEQVHYRNWTRHPILRSESLAQEESEPQNGVVPYTLRSLSNLKTNAAHNRVSPAKPKRCRSN